MVIIEDFVDGYEDALFRVCEFRELLGELVGQVIPYQGWCCTSAIAPSIVSQRICLAVCQSLSVLRGSRSRLTNYEGVLWQFLEETLLSGPVDVEVKGLRTAGEQHEAQPSEQRPHVVKYVAVERDGVANADVR